VADKETKTKFSDLELAHWVWAKSIRHFGRCY